MKKLLLLIASSSIALAADAQQKASFLTTQASEEQAWKKNTRIATFEGNPHRSNNAAAKGTAPNRLYSYRHWLDTTLQITATHTLANTSLPLWKDTLAQIAGTTTFNNTFVSVASVFDASFDGFNNPDFYPGQMKITNADGYTIKSLNLYGVYGFNPSKTAVKDTIRLTFVKGTGTTSPATDDIFAGYSLAAGGHYGTVDFLDVHYDSARNYMTNAVNMPGLTAPATMVVDVILDNSGTTPAWADTNVNGIWSGNVTLPGGGLVVPANGYAAVSISFRSGDGTFPTTPTGTVVWNNDGTFNYNWFMPLISYRTDGASDDAQWLTYTDPQAPDNNANCGYFRRLPAHLNGWGGTYIPMWAWSTGGGLNASSLQHPLVEWEVECTGCGLIDGDPPTSISSVNNINTASAYPNPAANELNVPFTLNSSSNATVTLTNVVGQVVATQSFTNVTSGKAVFNTATLANGVYSYSVMAGGQRTTGRVAIAK